MVELLGSTVASVLIASVALSLALTPSLAELGRKLAGTLRQRRKRMDDAEIVPRELTAPVFIVGMGEVGRTLADALTEFDIEYGAIERDQRRFADANADGYAVTFGDAADPRIWEPVAMHGRRITALTAPNLEVSGALTPITNRLYPNLRRFAQLLTRRPERFEAIGSFRLWKGERQKA
jgi:CPA2 family monovalent cation:H+ antiporter-2